MLSTFQFRVLMILLIPIWVPLFLFGMLGALIACAALTIWDKTA